ncbi:hypothetical protein EPI10_015716 [Gossypium australe]|uniref:Uncharacterized protein n=1 Tax=Gossypium australe TaxID=47621 RepID=A0A5B6VLJ6_9ROSI|nr:hypothetical protein EPI10_015716 [Gossypium australe]
MCHKNVFKRKKKLLSIHIGIEITITQDPNDFVVNIQKSLIEEYQECAITSRDFLPQLWSQLLGTSSIRTWPKQLLMPQKVKL